MKRLPPAQQYIQHHTQAENVRAAIHSMPLATSLLRTHVSKCPGVAWSLTDVLFLERQPKISDIRFSGAIQQDVARLDVPVDQSFSMSIVQSVGDRDDQCRRLTKG